MSEDRNMKPAKRKKRRRWPWVVAALLVAVVAATKAVEYVLHVDRYRPKVVERIGKATGLPASIDRLDLDLLPVPSLDVEGVSLGEADFRASAEQVELHLRVASLLRGAIEITEVEVDGLEITLP